VFAISLYIFHLSVSLISLAVASTIDIAYMFGAFDIDGKATQEGMENVCDAFRSKPTQREKREEEIERERERDHYLVLSPICGLRHTTDIYVCLLRHAFYGVLRQCSKIGLLVMPADLRCVDSMVYFFSCDNSPTCTPRVLNDLLSHVDTSD
jgi:hypothetical protein